MQYIQFLIQHWALSSALILILIAIFWLEMKGKVGGANRLSPSEAVLAINKQNAKVIDVREKGAYNEAHIVNSMHATKDEITDASPKLQKYKQQPILLVCANGTHSSTLGAQLHKQGFEQVFFLHGGINAWKADNLPLVKE